MVRKAASRASYDESDVDPLLSNHKARGRVGWKVK
jgi:hypothetical protein